MRHVKIYYISQNIIKIKSEEINLITRPIFL